MAEKKLIRYPNGKFDDDGGDPSSRYWYMQADDTRLASTLTDTIRQLRNKQSWRVQSDELAVRLHSDMSYVGYVSPTGARPLTEVMDSRLGDNFVRPICRVLDSKMARRRSRPYVVTNGGNFRQRTLSKNLENWLLGKLREIKFDSELAPQWRTHTLVYGTGCIRTYGDPKKGACAQVIPTNEIIVDDAEARYGNPRNIYIVRAESAEVLKAKYPDAADVIDNAKRVGLDKSNWHPAETWDSGNNNDQITIFEAYHLPSGHETGDGRYVITTDAGVIHSKEWKRDHFPLVFLRRERRPHGFWGIGVPEDVAANQTESTRSTLARQEMIETLAVPYWLVERGMKVIKSHITAIIGRVMEWTPTGSGSEPKLVAPVAVPPELWQHPEQLKRSSFESTGVSQLSAQMLKPSGLNSGKALRAYTEMEAELLSTLMNDHDEALLQLCELLIEEQVELGETVQGQKVTYIHDGHVDMIKWDQNLVKDLEYAIEILPASALASTLSARIEDVYDLRDLGVVTDPTELMDYLELPDRRRLQRKKLSHRHVLERAIEVLMVERGEWVEPAPTWDLNLAIDLALQTLNELELYEEVPEDRAELLRMFVEACRQLLEDAAQAALEEQAALQGDPSMMMGTPEEGLDGLDGTGSELGGDFGGVGPEPTPTDGGGELS